MLQNSGKGISFQAQMIISFFSLTKSFESLKATRSYFFVPATSSFQDNPTSQPFDINFEYEREYLSKVDSFAADFVFLGMM